MTELEALAGALRAGRLALAEVAGITPKELNAIYETAAARMDLGRADEAARMLGALVVLYPFGADYWRAYALALRALGDMDGARRAAAMTLLITPVEVAEPTASIVGPQPASPTTTGVEQTSPTITGAETTSPTVTATGSTASSPTLTRPTPQSASAAAASPPQPIPAEATAPTQTKPAPVLRKQKPSTSRPVRNEATAPAIVLKTRTEGTGTHTSAEHDVRLMEAPAAGPAATPAAVAARFPTGRSDAARAGRTPEQKAEAARLRSRREALTSPGGLRAPASETQARVTWPPTDEVDQIDRPRKEPTVTSIVDSYRAMPVEDEARVEKRMQARADAGFDPYDENMTSLIRRRMGLPMDDA